MKHPKHYFAFLDQMRGIAVISVFLYHALRFAFGYDKLPWGEWVSDFSVPKTFLAVLPLSFGDAGVPIFFVISGFCIHLSFSNYPQWLTFWKRRFFRLYPAYFAALLLFALLIPLSKVNFSTSGIGQLASHIFFIHNFNYYTFYTINPAFWSLAIEIQLYLLYPVLLFLVRRLGWRKSLLIIATLEISLRMISGIVFIYSGTLDPPWFRFNGLPLYYWYSWSIGVVIADAYLGEKKVPFANHSLIGWLGLAIFSSFTKPTVSLSFLFFALATATAIAKLISNQSLPLRLPRSLTNYLSDIGGLSYSIYLLHQPLLPLAPRIVAKLTSTYHANPLFILLVCLMLWVPIVGLSTLWYRLFERSGIFIGKKIGAPPRPLEPAQQKLGKP